MIFVCVQKPYMPLSDAKRSWHLIIDKGCPFTSVIHQCLHAQRESSGDVLLEVFHGSGPG